MNHKKGFTLIELIAVIAILGILILIASPSFLGSKEKAELALIKSDTKNVEKAVGAHILEFDILGKTDNHAGFKKISSGLKIEGKVYDTEGEFNGDIHVGGQLYNVSEMIDSSLNKEGFFIANNKGKAFYVHQKIRKDGEGEDGPKLTENSQEDFLWIRSESFYAYEFPNKGKGYWRYNGNDKEVVIPTYIEGVKLDNYGGMFRDNSTVVKVSSNNPDVVSTTGMFYGFNSQELDMSDFKGENVVSANGMFWNAKADTLNLSIFNPKSVEDMSSMFRNIDTKNLILGPNFKGENVINANSMFFESNINKIDLVNFNPKKAEDMIFMFKDSEAEEIILGPNFKGESVISTNSMFAGTKTKKIDLSNFNPKNVRNMGWMFKDSEAEEIILNPNFKGENVIITDAMFQGTKAKKIDLSNFDIKNVQNVGWMFKDSEAEEIILSPNFKGENVTIATSMFMGAKVKKIDLSNFNPKNTENMIAMFKDSEAEEIILGPNFKGESVTTTNSMFMGAKAKKIDLSNFNPKNTDNMIAMFKESEAEEIILGPNFKGESANSINSMFYGAKVKKIDLSNFNPKNVTNVGSLFRESKTKEIILNPDFKGENINDAHSMFRDSNVESLDLSSINFDRRNKDGGRAVKVDFIFENATVKTVYMDSNSMKYVKSYKSTPGHINFVIK